MHDRVPRLRRAELHRRRHGEGGAGPRGGRRGVARASTSRWTAGSTRPRRRWRRRPVPTSSWRALPCSATNGPGRRPTPSASVRAAAGRAGDRCGAWTPRGGGDAPRAVVAGGGIVGTWHALELVRAGFSVDHLEADAAPRARRCATSAWCGSAAGGPARSSTWPCGPVSRWEEVGAAVPGVGFRAIGSLTVACTGAERDVMQAVRPAPRCRHACGHLPRARGAACVQPGRRR